MIRVSVMLGVVTALSTVSLMPAWSAIQTLFPTGIPGDQWLTFRAEGYSKPACGVVYRLEDKVTTGMPLGAIDTGFVDLDTNGMYGYCTIFNTIIPRRGPVNVPLLGLNVGGQTWVLCQNSPKKGWGSYQDGPNGKPVIPVDTAGLTPDGVRTVKQIHYWGHYPVADLEFETGAPVQVGLRAWSPFLPGDVDHSMIPGAVFEVHLRNTSPSAQQGTLAFSFPGPTPQEAGATEFARKQVEGAFQGVAVSGNLASYALGVIGPEHGRTGGALGVDGAAWGAIATSLPATSSSEPGSSVAVDFSLAPGQSKVVRFVLAWSAPTWKGGGYNWSSQGHTFTHMYSKYYPDAVSTADLLAREHSSLLARVIGWQQVVYSDQKLPVWLRESLVNMLHLITEDGLWAQAKPPLPAWVKPEDGLFGLIESPRECPQIECIPCSFYGSLPLVYLFPKLALSTLRGYLGYQDPEGAPPWIFGGCTGGTPPVDFADPTRGYQVTMNGPCYVDMLDRYLMCYPSKDLRQEFYASVKKATVFTVDLNKGPDGLISMPDHKVSVGGIPWESEWFEWYEWHGMVTHVGAIHLAMLRMVERMAKESGDAEFVRKCAGWIEQGSQSLETKMWDPAGYYLNYWDPKAGLKSDIVFGYQLDGEWMTESHGLPGVFRPDRVKTTLATIKRVNVPPTKYGAINYAYADGRVLKPGESPMRGDYAPYDFFSPELFMLAMTYMYNGQKDLGLELTQRCMNNIVCEQGLTWDMPNIIRGDTGERGFGADYYQNLVLWALPAAMEDKDLSAPVRRGGLVQRIIQAARAGGSQ